MDEHEQLKCLIDKLTAGKEEILKNGKELNFELAFKKTELMKDVVIASVTIVAGILPIITAFNVKIDPYYVKFAFLFLSTVILVGFVNLLAKNINEGYKIQKEVKNFLEKTNNLIIKDLFPIQRSSQSIDWDLIINKLNETYPSQFKTKTDYKDYINFDNLIYMMFFAGLIFIVAALWKG